MLKLNSSHLLTLAPECDYEAKLVRVGGRLWKPEVNEVKWRVAKYGPPFSEIVLCI